MRKNKLNLAQIKVKSFVTTLETKQKVQILGGSRTDGPDKPGDPDRLKSVDKPGDPGDPD